MGYGKRHGNAVNESLLPRHLYEPSHEYRQPVVFPRSQSSQLLFSKIGNTGPVFEIYFKGFWLNFNERHCEGMHAGKPVVCGGGLPFSLAVPSPPLTSSNFLGLFHTPTTLTSLFGAFTPLLKKDPFAVMATISLFPEIKIVLNYKTIQVEFLTICTSLCQNFCEMSCLNLIFQSH